MRFASAREVPMSLASAYEHVEWLNREQDGGGGGSFCSCPRLCSGGLRINSGPRRVAVALVSDLVDIP